MLKNEAKGTIAAAGKGTWSMRWDGKAGDKEHVKSEVGAAVLGATAAATDKLIRPPPPSTPPLCPCLRLR